MLALNPLFCHWITFGTAGVLFADAGRKSLRDHWRGPAGLAALVTAFAGWISFANGKQAFSQPLWTWMSVGNFNIGFNLGAGRPVADHASGGHRRRLS
ncbi:hypothetical protein KCP75_12025 [Salmonella enterica subsp. enterica]|nr:hypothetical protein KCP75_12025 [Salmonella enterica subsp. enterica]